MRFTVIHRVALHLVNQIEPTIFIECIHNFFLQLLVIIIFNYIVLLNLWYM